MNTYGDGRPAPPRMARETVELQRVAGRIANSIRRRAEETHWINIEADVSSTMLRLVFHYRKGGTRPRTWDEAHTVELDLTAGHPIDDSIWLEAITDDVWNLIRSGESDLVIPRTLDFVRYTDNEGKTMFHEGNALELDQAKQAASNGHPSDKQ